MFGRLQTDCGYTPAQIRAMTMADVHRVFKYWGTYPPVRDLVAMFIGFEMPTDEPPPKPMSAEEFKMMISMTGGRVPGMS